MGNLGWMTYRTAAIRLLVGVVVVLGFPWGFPGPAGAAPPVSPLEPNTSNAARRDAIRSIPFDKLSAVDRAKVKSVLSNVSVFRRLPTKVIDCDPDMYLFLVRQPDVVVNIWELFKMSRLQFRQTGNRRFHIVEPGGTTASVEFLYRSHDLQIVYGEGFYNGPPLIRPVKGRGVLVLKSGYVRETNDRYYVTSRMDCFLSVEPVGAEFVTKTVSPFVGKTVDANFALTLAFVGSLSRTAEVNSHGVQRLAARLAHVQPEVRKQFSVVASNLSQKPVASRAAKTARRSEPKKQPPRG